MKQDCNNCLVCPNKQCILKHCSADFIRSIQTNKNSSFYKKGQHIIVEGNSIFGIFFIRKGHVKVTSSNMDGKEQIVRLATTGHIIGHRGFGGEKYLIGAVALIDSQICFLDNEVLYKAFMTNPEFTYNMMIFYSTELRNSEQRLKYLAQMTIHERVVYALVYIIELFELNVNSQNSALIILSREEIAAIAGTRSDQISRQLTELKQQNCVDTSGHTIIIKDLQKLQKIISRYEVA